MRTIVLSALTVSTLALAACAGSDDAGNDGGDSSDGTVAAEGGDRDVGSDQQRVIDLLLSGAGEAGIELDEECVNETVGRLSDADAASLADAGLEGEADISDEGDAIGEAVFSDCVDAASYAQAQIDAIGQVDETVDSECLRDALDGLTVDEIDQQIIDAATECTADG